MLRVLNNRTKYYDVHTWISAELLFHVSDYNKQSNTLRKWLPDRGKCNCSEVTHLGSCDVKY